MEEDVKERRRKMAKIIAKAWSDESFRARLEKEPRAVLAENGIYLPEGVEVKVVEQTEKEIYLVIPFKPDDHDGGSWMCEDDAYDIPCARCN